MPQALEAVLCSRWKQQRETVSHVAQRESRDVEVALQLRAPSLSGHIGDGNGIDSDDEFGDEAGGVSGLSASPQAATPPRPETGVDVPTNNRPSPKDAASPTSEISSEFQN